MAIDKHTIKSTNDSPCLLKGLDGVTYQALLGNLTLTGASITIRDNVPHGLRVGEMCGLVLSERPNRSSSKYTGMITELDSGIVGISFHHQGHSHQKHQFTPPS